MKTALLIAASSVLATTALAQSPVDPNTPDGTRPAPIEIIAGMVDGTPVCRPDAFRMPVDNTVVLLLRNESGDTIDFTAPELFASATVGERVGGQAWVMEDGAQLLRVPATGEIELPLRVEEAGLYTFACLVPGSPENRMEGTIEAVPTPSDG